MKNSIVPIEMIENHIYIIRGHRVMLDQDLATLYDTPTKRLNEQLRRNTDRFPEDFAFQLRTEEWEVLRSQIATSNEGRGGRRYLPTVFTEHGALMLANILRSKRAVKMSIQVIRAFNHMRQLLVSHLNMAKEVSEIKSFALKHSRSTDTEFKRVWRAIEKLSEPPTETRKIGFRLT